MVSPALKSGSAFPREAICSASSSAIRFICRAPIVLRGLPADEFFFAAGHVPANDTWPESPRAKLRALYAGQACGSRGDDAGEPVTRPWHGPDALPMRKNTHRH